MIEAMVRPLGVGKLKQNLQDQRVSGRHLMARMLPQGARLPEVHNLLAVWFGLPNEG
jgi:hypothetical protein